ncbi:Uncharacterised protein [Raoultella terrigena]|uniref:Fatty acid desaturase n=1 Tax=Raoultella terrigena TaxID=577 RepID=A0A3P8JT59_RAOTE|nr:Uncharacterised protein [Raoultella terrigena]
MSPWPVSAIIRIERAPQALRLTHFSGKAKSFKYFVIFRVISHLRRIKDNADTVFAVMAKKTSVYLHPQQRDLIRQLSRSRLWRSELPTWLLIITIYGGWFATLVYWQTLGLLPATLLLIWFSAWYMSLQHELIHGHPTRWPRLNQLLGILPLAVWYPYGLYRGFAPRAPR